MHPDMPSLMPNDLASYAALSDWLEERGEQSAAEQVRALPAMADDVPGWWIWYGAYWNESRSHSRSLSRSLSLSRSRSLSRSHSRSLSRSLSLSRSHSRSLSRSLSLSRSRSLSRSLSRSHSRRDYE